MKKTLIALAVLAASGASFAQVTITGTFATGYQADHFGTGSAAIPIADRSGLGVDTAEIYFNVSEDLGGGTKATAKLGFDGVTRASANGGDAVLALSGAFGTLTLSTTKGTDYLSAGVAKVGGTGMDGKVFSARTTADSIAYAYAFGPVTVSLAHSEPGNTLGLGNGAAGAPGQYTTQSFDQASGLTNSAATNQRTTRLAAKYVAGMLVVDGGYATYDNSTGSPVANLVGGDLSNDKSQMRLAASYHFGVAKLGAGWVENARIGGTRTDTLISAALPLGALTLGADYATRTTSSFAAAASNGTISGYGLSAGYALSKRTALSLSYTLFKQSLTALENSSSTAVLLAHSF